MKRIIVWACLSTIRIFYKRIRVAGLEHVPKDGPLLVVANHPNGLMDPGVVRVGLGVEVGFLAKSTLFDNPVGKLTMDAFQAIPVFRAQDGNDTSKNNETFALCQERLKSGGSLVIFPEGVSHSDTRMKRLKTGAARIALQTQDSAPDLNLYILPVGLFYEAKEIFRSQVSLAVGEPIRVKDYLESFHAEGFAAASALTEEIGHAFGGLVLQAESAEVWDGLVAVARWTDPVAAADLAVAQHRAQELSLAYRKLVVQEPLRAEALTERVQAFAHLLRTIGVEDPWDVESPKAGLSGFLWLFSLLMWLPFATFGVLTSWPFYRALGPIAHALAGKERDLVSTMKAILGLVLLPVIWLVEAVVAGWFLGWAWTPLLLIAIPACGYVALRFGESVAARREVFKAYWLASTRASRVAEIRRRRQELTAEVEAELKELLIQDVDAERAAP